MVPVTLQSALGPCPETKTAGSGTSSSCQRGLGATSQAGSKDRGADWSAREGSLQPVCRRTGVPVHTQGCFLWQGLGRVLWGLQPHPGPNTPQCRCHPPPDNRKCVQTPPALGSRGRHSQSGTTAPDDRTQARDFPHAGSSTGKSHETPVDGPGLGRGRGALVCLCGDHALAQGTRRPPRCPARTHVSTHRPL